MRCDRQLANSVLRRCKAKIVMGGILNLIFLSSITDDAQVYTQDFVRGEKNDPTERLTLISRISPHNRNKAISSTGLVSHAYNLRK